MPRLSPFSLILFIFNFFCAAGSTGKPKGVMHNFKAMTVTTQGIIKLFHFNGNDRYLSYLPLSHGMERWLGEMVPLYTGLHVFYADSLTTFVADLVRCHPSKSV